MHQVGPLGIEASGIDPLERAEIERVMAAWSQRPAPDGIERLGGLTNRTFKVVTGAETVAVRLPGPGTDAYIDRGAELHNAQVASALQLGPRILHASEGALVSAYLEGRVLSAEVVATEDLTLERAGRLLGRVHAAEPAFASRFEPLAVVAAHRARLHEVPTGTDDLIARFAAMDPPPRRTPCHNDPWPENFVDTEEGLRLLDWEYSAMGDPAWDLADLSVEADLDDRGVDRLLRAYTGGQLDAALRSRVESLVPLTDLLWGLWALVQTQDANPADDFATYARARLDRARRTVDGPSR